MGCAAGRDEIISDSYHDQFAARHGAGELLAGRESGNAPVVRLGESALAPGIPISDWSRSGNWVRRWRSTNSYMQRNWLNACSLQCRFHNAVISLGACAAGTLSAFLCGLDHRQDARCCATIQHPCFKEVAVPESDNSRKRALLTSGGRLHAVGGRRSWPRLADAFRSDGEGMVQFGGSGT